MALSFRSRETRPPPWKCSLHHLGACQQFGPSGFSSRLLNQDLHFIKTPKVICVHVKIESNGSAGSRCTQVRHNWDLNLDDGEQNRGRKERNVSCAANGKWLSFRGLWPSRRRHPSFSHISSPPWHPCSFTTIPCWLPVTTPSPEGLGSCPACLPWILLPRSKAKSTWCSPEWMLL